jgi:hypothetical protein
VLRRGRENQRRAYETELTWQRPSHAALVLENLNRRKRKMVELRTRILGLIAGMLMLGWTGLTPAQRELGRAMIGNATAVPHATSSNDEHMAPAERNLPHKVRRNGDLFLFFPLSLELNHAVVSQLDGFITLHSAGIQTKTMDKAIPGLCRLLAARNRTARQLLVGFIPRLATPERIEFWRTTGLRNRPPESFVLRRCDG